MGFKQVSKKVFRKVFKKVFKEQTSAETTARLLSRWSQMSWAVQQFQTLAKTMVARIHLDLHCWNVQRPTLLKRSPIVQRR